MILSGVVASSGGLVPLPISVGFLVIAGGGGTTNISGGGGAGGYRTSVGTSGGGGATENPQLLLTLTEYAVTVGAGGAIGEFNQTGFPGSNSIFNSVTSIGGGGGGTRFSSTSSRMNGGSGGGGTSFNGSMTGGSATVGQGFKGGNSTSPGDFYTQAGGGGAASAGVDVTGNTLVTGSLGGNGVSSDITGSAVFRAGGGSGLGMGSASSGGTRGEIFGGTLADNGAPNTGAGAGGANGDPRTGGSGLVILRYPSQNSIQLGAGLSGSTAVVGLNKVTQITAGTGVVTFI